jgi:hypothetical protein
MNWISNKRRRRAARTTLAIALVSLIAAGCRPDASDQPTKIRGGSTMTLKENAQVRLNGAEVGCANIGLGDYSTADGAEREGMTAQLSLPDGGPWIVVGDGSVFEAGGKKWKVLSVSEGEPWGSVEVEPIESSGR